MPNVTTLNTSTARAIGEGAAAALAEFAAKHGLKVSYAGGSLETQKFVCKVTFTQADPVAALTAAKADWDRWCHSFDLKPEQFGKVFVSNRRRYTITGIAPTRTKNVVKAVEEFTGKEFIFPAYAARSAA